MKALYKTLLQGREASHSSESTDAIEQSFPLRSSKENMWESWTPRSSTLGGVLLVKAGAGILSSNPFLEALFPSCILGLFTLGHLPGWVVHIHTASTEAVCDP